MPRYGNAPIPRCRIRLGFASVSAPRPDLATALWGRACWPLRGEEVLPLGLRRETGRRRPCFRARVSRERLKKVSYERRYGRERIPRFRPRLGNAGTLSATSPSSPVYFSARPDYPRTHAAGRYHPLFRLVGIALMMSHRFSVDSAGCCVGWGDPSSSAALAGG